MIIEQRIKDFEKLGFGMFVHFGIYSVFGRGEWAKHHNKMEWEEYLTSLERFSPVEDWAEQLVSTAENAGCRYITLTTRHHDGFSLFDTCGLNDYDAPHVCGRDLVREFVDACRRHGIIPFFYHTLLDWHEESYEADFKTYLKYLRDSVEILCTNYGEIGGLWFDGKWNKPEEDWEEDALYSMIRSHQPQAMIINNTGLSHRGELGHIELDSVTFERGRPKPINLEDSSKYIASEMCETLCQHWGYAHNDFNYQSTAELIRSFAICRRYRSNFLLNVGPKGDGTLRTIDRGILEVIGAWHAINEEALHLPAPTGIEVEDNPDHFLLREGDDYYLFVCHLRARGSSHVVLHGTEEIEPHSTFALDRPVRDARWLDTGEPVIFEQKDGRITVETVANRYGENYVVRVAKLTV